MVALSPAGQPLLHFYLNLKVVVLIFVSIINPRWSPPQDKFNIGVLCGNVFRLSVSETTKPFDSNFCWNTPGWFFTICVFLCQSKIYVCHRRAKLILTLDRIENVKKKKKISEIINLIEFNLYLNYRWVGPYKMLICMYRLEIQDSCHH